MEKQYYCLILNLTGNEFDYQHHKHHYLSHYQHLQTSLTVEVTAQMHHGQLVSWIRFMIRHYNTHYSYQYKAWDLLHARAHLASKVLDRLNWFFTQCEISVQIAGDKRIKYLKLHKDVFHNCIKCFHNLSYWNWRYSLMMLVW